MVFLNDKPTLVPFMERQKCLILPYVLYYLHLPLKLEEIVTYSASPKDRFVWILVHYSSQPEGKSK